MSVVGVAGFADAVVAADISANRSTRQRMKTHGTGDDIAMTERTVVVGVGDVVFGVVTSDKRVGTDWAAVQRRAAAIVVVVVAVTDWTLIGRVVSR